ncbi:MAG: carbohydrate ABC transporter permease [Fimbriimonas sp.]|nr:carbohydrate ABC transporter permease [Fimbriimonas sp.]
MKPGKILALAVATLGLAICLAPVIWLFSTSLKPFGEILRAPTALIPKHARPQNFTDFFSSFTFWRSFANSCIVAVLSVLGTLASSIPAGYAFARLKARGSGLVFALLIASLMLPGQVTIVPVFRLFASLGMIDTFYPLVLPAWLGTNAFAIFLMRQFFLSIPEEMLEAARLDGASEGRILLRVAAPLAKPAIATVAIFAFLGSWNDLWGPLIYLNKESSMTLMVSLMNFVGGSGTAQGTPWNLVMAGVVVTVLPAFVLFAMFQKTFVAGISTTGLK